MDLTQSHQTRTLLSGHRQRVHLVQHHLCALHGCSDQNAATSGVKRADRFHGTFKCYHEGEKRRTQCVKYYVLGGVLQGGVVLF